MTKDSKTEKEAAVRPRRQPRAVGQPVLIGHLPAEFRAAAAAEAAKLPTPPPELLRELAPVVAPALQKIAEEQERMRQEAGTAAGKLPVAEMDRLFWPGIDLAHLAPPPAGLGIFCEPDADQQAMRGRTWDERDWAATLPLCQACVGKAPAPAPVRDGSRKRRP